MNNEQTAVSSTAADTELIVANGGEVSLVDATDDIIASAERRIANVGRILTLSLKMTNSNDWVDQHGKPYLAGSGAEKVARLFGVCWKKIETKKVVSSDERGNFYFYEAGGFFRLKNDEIYAIGTCSSKDQFFGVEKDKETGEHILKPLSEVDETNILKSAITNCICNGVTKLLGLRNLTWEQVEAAGGVKRGQVVSVKYATGGKGGGLISEPQAKRLFAILMTGSSKEDKQRREDALKSALQAKGYESSRDIKREDYEAICAAAESIANAGVVGE